jgi:Family of unknown function (DUF5988)
MTDTTTVSGNSDFVHAVLEGGPASIPEALRSLTVNPAEDNVKIPFYGGYEHFVRADMAAADAVRGHVVFRWTTRTEIAE